MVAFWVDEELEGGIEVAVGFANRADVVRGVIAKGDVGFGGGARHFGDLLEMSCLLCLRRRSGTELGRG